MKIIKNDEAVSPVIGVILMVAITVILAAVIAAFVFGMAGTTSTSKNVGLSVALLPYDATDDATYAAITVNGGTDIPSLNTIVYSIDGGVNWRDVTSSKTGSEIDVTSFSVGRIVYTWHNVKGERLQIKGTFDDGSEQVLFDRNF